MEWEIKSYDGQLDQLVETDLQYVMKMKDEQQESGGRVAGNGEAVTEKVEGKRKAVVIKLRLGTSQYATMALREVMKGRMKSYVAVWDGEKTKDVDEEGNVHTQSGNSLVKDW